MLNSEQFAKRKRTVKIVWNILFLLSAIITIVLVSLAINDKETVYYEYLEEYAYYTKVKYIVPLYLLGTWDVFCIVFWLCSIVGVKYHTYQYNGHEIGLYLGWSCAYLLLDSVVVDKHTGSFFGARPLECDLGGEKVYLKVGTFTLNNYTLRVGNKVLH